MNSRLIPHSREAVNSPIGVLYPLILDNQNTRKHDDLILPHACTGEGNVSATIGFANIEQGVGYHELSKFRREVLTSQNPNHVPTLGLNNVKSINPKEFTRVKARSFTVELTPRGRLVSLESFYSFIDIERIFSYTNAVEYMLDPNCNPNFYEATGVASSLTNALMMGRGMSGDKVDFSPGRLVSECMYYIKVLVNTLAQEEGLPLIRKVVPDTPRFVQDELCRELALRGKPFYYVDTKMSPLKGRHDLPITSPLICMVDRVNQFLIGSRRGQLTPLVLDAYVERLNRNSLDPRNPFKVRQVVH